MYFLIMYSETGVRAHNHLSDVITTRQAFYQCVVLCVFDTSFHRPVMKTNILSRIQIFLIFKL